MKFNALQRYLLKVYAITIIILTIFVPIYSSTGSASFGIVLIEQAANINIGFLLTEYLGLTLATVACLLATNKEKR